MKRFKLRVSRNARLNVRIVGYDFLNRVMVAGNSVIEIKNEVKRWIVKNRRYSIIIPDGKQDKRKWLGVEKMKLYYELDEGNTPISNDTTVLNFDEKFLSRSLGGESEWNLLLKIDIPPGSIVSKWKSDKVINPLDYFQFDNVHRFLNMDSHPISDDSVVIPKVIRKNEQSYFNIRYDLSNSVGIDVCGKEGSVGPGRNLISISNSFLVAAFGCASGVYIIRTFDIHFLLFTSSVVIQLTEFGSPKIQIHHPLSIKFCDCNDRLLFVRNEDGVFGFYLNYKFSDRKDLNVNRTNFRLDNSLISSERLGHILGRFRKFEVSKKGYIGLLTYNNELLLSYNLLQIMGNEIKEHGEFVAGRILPEYSVTSFSFSPPGGRIIVSTKEGHILLVNIVKRCVNVKFIFSISPSKMKNVDFSKLRHLNWVYHKLLFFFMPRPEIISKEVSRSRDLEKEKASPGEPGSVNSVVDDEEESVVGDGMMPTSVLFSRYIRNNRIYYSGGALIFPNSCFSSSKNIKKNDYNNQNQNEDSQSKSESSDENSNNNEYYHLKYLNDWNVVILVSSDDNRVKILEEFDDGWFPLEYQSFQEFNLINKDFEAICGVDIDYTMRIPLGNSPPSPLLYALGSNGVLVVKRIAGVNSENRIREYSSMGEQNWAYREQWGRIHTCQQVQSMYFGNTTAQAEEGSVIDLWKKRIMMDLQSEKTFVGRYGFDQDYFDRITFVKKDVCVGDENQRKEEEGLFLIDVDFGNGFVFRNVFKSFFCL